ncbi:MAG TPA: hypothetical protein VKR53_10190 [Puia sp.]|nr:hypothetical protein [Puia sp.]
MKKFVLLTIIFYSIASCSSWRNSLATAGSKNDAIINAILDFTHSHSFRGKDSVFSIHVQDINEEILGVSILADRNKIAVVTENESTYSYKGFPSSYFEKNGKLFYWNDSAKNVSPDVIKKFSEIMRIDTIIVGKYMPPRILDDAERSTDYYFCVMNLKKYKRVTSRIAMGRYSPPNLNCDTHGK